ncbi:MAG: helix-turn-helix transcriptional regulator [Solirubrobacterales bacterium]|nr:helix-turn-helix transcriptional regulator [Solirubrobacterales bacterium]
MRDLASGPRRFVELQRVLPGISTEQLRSRLNRMVADGMLTRQRYREVPPRVDYELTPRAKDLLPVLAELSRWGYEWAWSPPRNGEAVDIGAIFRLAGGLATPSNKRQSVELTVTDGDREGGATVFTLALGPREISIVEDSAEDPTAKAKGATSAWVKAFGPNVDLSALQIDGDRAIVEKLITELAQEKIQAKVAERDQAAGEDQRAA